MCTLQDGVFLLQISSTIDMSKEGGSFDCIVISYALCGPIQYVCHVIHGPFSLNSDTVQLT
jgi:hypothetical protein